MKSKLIIDLISAHVNGDEADFAGAVERLASDEEKKGNIALAMDLRSSYGSKGKPSFSAERAVRKEMFVLQNVPHDKDTGLGLVEFIEPDVSIDDVVLSDGIKASIMQVVSEWRDPSILPTGIGPTSSILFTGPPGCGKTSVSKAIAAMLGIPLAVVRPDGIISSYLGQTGANIRKVFEAVRGTRCVLFMDEFESIGKNRMDSNDVGEVKRMMTSLLQNMDSLSGDVLLIAATNLSGMLDPAAVRRFDLSIEIGLPDRGSRKRLAELFASRHEVDLGDVGDIVADMSAGLSCADELRVLKAAAKSSAISNGGHAVLTIEGLVSASGGDWEVARRLHESGVALREVERITGIPRSTLSYRFGGKR